ncbi:hypothetical protein [Candidatus Absconditicoccus praedator]|uniref:hypothetical protein n=1 Tax=Candidatus Absconditicoccus praedator TaxID=2735562 RepID=UPI001E41C55F|nr:hypothetical protein [Candidatus Absconditicoccus praedator]UFX83291.1 hypothetical protein HLG78_04130 [Candidatus Absconditicoccus praedator]
MLKKYYGPSTERGNLKEIIVGDVENFNLKNIEETFKVLFGENLRHSTFENFKDYRVDSQKIKERQEDLDNLSELLKKLGVKVYRPERLERVKAFRGPYFKGVMSSAANPRDLIFVYKDKIIESTPGGVNRYFEKDLYYKILQEKFEEGAVWLSAPSPSFRKGRFDFKEWDEKRDFKNFDRLKYDIVFEAAHMLKLGDDILFNISSYMHELGADWMQKVLGSDTRIHKVYYLDDNHIDGKLSALSRGIFLANNELMQKDIKNYLPKKFHDWKVIYTGEESGKFNHNSYLDTDMNYIQLCSMRGANTNVLSISENRVLVMDYAEKTIKKLEENGFDVIPVRMRHCELFGGGLHCATLDLKRED